MNAAVLAAGLHDAPLVLRREERLSTLFAPVRDISSLTAIIVAGSVTFHAALLAMAFIGARPPAAAPKEIAVEIVQEAPQPAPRPAPAPMAKPPVPPEPQKATVAKPPEPVKSAQMAKPPEAPKPVPTKLEQAKSNTATTDLQKEIDKLRAEEAALKSELANAADPKAGASGKAVALAASTDGDGDPVGYQQIVFSQLAKAKDGDGFQGATGITGVRFEIADSGALAGVEVVTPSGDANLDREAVSIVHRAAPFPPPPKDAERTVFANVNFVPPRRP